jgi:hypothetical protein
LQSCSRFGWRLGRITMPGSAAFILGVDHRQRPVRIAWRWSVMRRRRCTRSPGRALISACAM